MHFAAFLAAPWFQLLFTPCVQDHRDIARTVAALGRIPAPFVDTLFTLWMDIRHAFELWQDYLTEQHRRAVEEDELRRDIVAFEAQGFIGYNWAVGRG